MSVDWQREHRFWIRAARQVARRSPEATKVGAVLRTSNGSMFCGYNRALVPRDGLPPWLAGDRDARRTIALHAEVDVIFQALGAGGPDTARGSHLYLSCGAHPCIDCAKLLLHAGVREIYGEDLAFEGSPGWSDNLRFARRFLIDHGVRFYDLILDEEAA